MTHPEMPPSPSHPHHSYKKVIVTAIIFFILGLAWLLYYLLYARFYQSTTDAYVDGNNVILTPQVNGIVNAFYALDADFVPEGKVLVELDQTDALIALDKAVAELGEAVRDVCNLFESAKKEEAIVAMKKALFVKTAQDYEHRKYLVEDGGVSLEDFEHAEAALKSSFADLIASEHALIAILCQIENTTIDTHPLVEEAKNKVRSAFVFYQRCTLVAPVTGIISMRSVQIGSQVKTGQSLLSIVPLDQMWVTANFKEVQLSKMRVGQSVEVKSDMYGDDVVYKGKVAGIGGGTGSVFSILPPQNATGNWIKIVQRVPVRIILDQDQIQEHPLRLGLSMDVSVDIHDIDLPKLPDVRSDYPLFTTPVFADQEEGAEELIEDVIAQNLSPTFMEEQK